MRRVLNDTLGCFGFLGWMTSIKASYSIKGANARPLIPQQSLQIGGRIAQNRTIENFCALDEFLKNTQFFHCRITNGIANLFCSDHRSPVRLLSSGHFEGIAPPQIESI